MILSSYIAIINVKQNREMVNLPILTILNNKTHSCFFLTLPISVIYCFDELPCLLAYDDCGCPEDRKWLGNNNKTL